MKSAIKITAFALLAAAFGASLAGCSKEDDDRLPGGTQPVTLTAMVEGQSAPQAAQTATRATTDNTWAGGEEVAVQIGSEVKKYTAAVGGKLTVASGVELWYWQKTTDEKAVEAWHAATYSAAKPISFTVAADQSGDGYQQSDMLYANATISYISPELVFHHLPAKVVVNLKAGDGVTAADVQSADVTLVGQSLTSGAIAANWSVTKLTTSGSETITPNTLTTPTGGFLKTVQAIVVPQVSTLGVRFIKVSVGGQEFFYSTVLDFGTGKQQTYNIEVKKNGLSVTASGAEAWTGTTTDVTSVDIYTAADLKMGDYYYSNGTYSDGGLRKRYADGTFEKNEVSPDGSRTVCGIVYWVGDPTNTTSGDPLLATHHPSCTHGLVVALHEAKQPSASAVAKMEWSNNFEQVNNWTNHSDRGATKVDITVQDKMQGYANTVALTAYNAQQTNDKLKVLPISAIEQYHRDYPAPSNSSGWYVPSIMELKYMCWGQGNSQGTIGRDLLNGQFAKAGGTNFDSSYWWSSSECAAMDYARSVGFGDGSVYYNLKGFEGFWVRTLFAF